MNGNENLPPAFQVIGATEVMKHVAADREGCLAAVAAAYRAHSAGDTRNPQSTFLRFPDSSDDRIISLPAYIGGDLNVAGIKWISSFPGNTSRGLPRASAVLVLNDMATGFPVACLESSIISATRTAASGVLAAEHLIGDRKAARVAVIGAGFIARHVALFLRDLGWDIGSVSVFDVESQAACGFADEIRAAEFSEVVVHDDIGETIRSSDLVIFTTVASTPHVVQPAWFSHRPVVLHLSLRDLAPPVVRSAQNITDDIDHVLRERTSLHLTELEVGHRQFIDGTVGDLLDGRLSRDHGRPAIFSPFGLGILDLAVGKWVHSQMTRSSAPMELSNFHPQTANCRSDGHRTGRMS